MFIVLFLVFAKFSKPSSSADRFFTGPLHCKKIAVTLRIKIPVVSDHQLVEGGQIYNSQNVVIHWSRKRTAKYRIIKMDALRWNWSLQLLIATGKALSEIIFCLKWYFSNEGNFNFLSRADLLFSRDITVHYYSSLDFSIARRKKWKVIV